MTEQKLSFVIPCYGSEKTVGFVVDEIVSEMQKNGVSDYEFL